MEYTKEERAEMVKVLRYVAERLKKENDFICILVTWSSPGARRARDAVREMIRQRLGKFTTLEAWVAHNLPESLWKDVLVKMEYRGVSFKDENGHSIEQMRQYRLRWVKELIRELS